MNKKQYILTKSLSPILDLGTLKLLALTVVPGKGQTQVYWFKQFVLVKKEDFGFLERLLFLCFVSSLKALRTI